MKKLTGKEWFRRLETAFPGTLERVCRESGFRPGDNMDREVAKTLDTLAYLTGGPTLTPDIVGHARREYGIVKRAALPRVTPKPEAPPPPIEVRVSPEITLEARSEPSGNANVDAQVAASLERLLPGHFERLDSRKAEEALKIAVSMLADLGEEARWRKPEEEAPPVDVWVIVWVRTWSGSCTGLSGGRRWRMTPGCWDGSQWLFTYRAEPNPRNVVLAWRPAPSGPEWLQGAEVNHG